MARPEILLQAIALVRAGKHGEAEGVLRAVLAATPDDPHALFLLGDCVLLSGRAGEAAELLARAVARRRGHRDSRLALARALLATARPADALDTLAPFAGDAGLPAAQALRGAALNALNRPAEAVDAFRLALAANPEDPEVLLNCGNALAELDQPEEAERLVRRAVALHPGLTEARASLAHLLIAAGDPEGAAAAARAALALDPGLPTAHWNLGIASLLLGDLPAGWREYEWRKRNRPESFTALPGPQWDGGPLDGRTILVLAEQGLGDTIHMARFLPLLQQIGGRVAVQCAPGLVPLLQTVPGVEAYGRGTVPPHDCWADQMSLPLLFGTTLGTIPGAAGYLRADPDGVAEWRRRLPPGLGVGLAWAGNPLHSNDRRRSVPAGMLQPILRACPGHLVGLQMGPRAADLPQLAGYGPWEDWKQTTAAVAALDLVITVDTAVAHLAGALAVPTWLMLPFAPDWRWMRGRSDSPWYASMRLFRQDRAGDWAGVVARVADALRTYSPPGQNIAMPPLT